MKCCNPESLRKFQPGIENAAVMDENDRSWLPLFFNMTGGEWFGEEKMDPPPGRVDDARHSGSFDVGSVTMNDVPLPNALSAVIVPRWARMMPLAIASPSPIPPLFRDLPSSVR